MVLTPNTSYDGDTGLVSIAGQQGGRDSGYANGNGSSAFTVNGSNATNNYFASIVGRNRIPYLYGEDAIEEFQVAVSPYTSVYGGGGGFVNAVTRSGGNAFHGSAFYYNRNSATGANDALDQGRRQSETGRCFAAIRRRAGRADPAKPLVVLRGLQRRLRNDAISVINSALTATAANLAGLSANFDLRPGRRCLRRTDPCRY